MSTTSIEWAGEVLNFIKARRDGTTCDPVSAGCKNCFAQVFAKRLKGVAKKFHRDFFIYENHHLCKDYQHYPSEGTECLQTGKECNAQDCPRMLYETKNSIIKVDFDVLKTRLNKLKKKTKRVFLESMSDLFHKDIPDEDIAKVLLMLYDYPQHEFLILTKRFKRLCDFTYLIDFPKHIHFGVSVCDSSDLDLLDVILEKYNYSPQLFISFEPLLGYISLGDLKTFFKNSNVNWVICGAETGNGKRPFKEEWALDILYAARQNNIPFFFKKQYKNGEWTNKLYGTEYLEFPEEVK